MTKKKSDKPIAEAEQTTEVDTAETVSLDPAETAEVIEAEIVEESDISDEPSEETPAEEQTTDEAISSDPVAAAQTPERKGSFFPLLIGGIVAGAVGFGASAYMEPKSWPFGSDTTDEVQAAIDAQGSDLQALQQQVADMQGQFATTDAVADTTQSVAELQQTIDDVSQTLAGLDDRLTQLEALPAASGDGESQASILAFEAEMQALRQEVESQKTALEAAAAEAVETQQSAEDALRMEAARAALGVIQIAGDTGQPFADALAEFKANSDAEVASVLDETAQTGVPTLTQIQADVADNARSALAASRAQAEAPESVTGRLSAFLKSQTGARSVTPKEGSDPDAVLSRVEAAVKDGQLTDAMAELEQLPEVGRAEMSDWISSVNTRLEALNAIDALSDALASN